MNALRQMTQNDQVAQQGAGSGTDLPSDFSLLLSQLMQSPTSTPQSTWMALLGALAGLETPLGTDAAGDLSAGGLLPVQGEITQRFGSGHKGVDVAVPEGTPVASTQTGKVVYAGWNDEGYGNLVIVQAAGQGTYYAHLSQVEVSAGQEISAGQIVGLSGNTGNSTGPHVHYELRINGTPVDPLPSGG